MAYTYEQLVKAYAAVHGGNEPTGEVASQLRLLTNASFTDTDRMAYILNSADQSTAVAVLSYQFFTGKAPSAEGMDYLLKSGPANLNGEVYAKFNLENRFMNFATNLALEGDGKAAFQSNYGSMTYAQYVASIYETIIGKAQATAAGLNPEQTILDIIARQDLILASARNNGVIGPNATAAEIDLALKAATAAYLLAEGIKADVGVYAGATNNFMIAVATGKATYDTDITKTYAPTTGSGSTGVGQAVDTPPAFDDLPGAPPPAPEPEPQGPPHQTFTLTAGTDKFTGRDGDDTFNATDLTFSDDDVLKGGAGHDTLNIVATVGGGGSWYSTPNNGTTGIETVNITSNVGASAHIPAWADVTALNLTAAGGLYASVNAAAKVTGATTAQGSASITVTGGTDIKVTSTGATDGKITVGSEDIDDKPTGDVVVTREMIGSNTGGDITVYGGKTVSVTQTADLPSGYQTQGKVSVFGSALTTEVTIKGQAFSTGNADVLAGSVEIGDYRSGTDVAGKITKVTIDGYNTAIINGNAVTNLSLSNGQGDVMIDNSGLITPTNKTLNLRVDNLQVYIENSTPMGAVRDAGIYTALNITTGAADSELADLGFSAVTNLALNGASKLVLRSAGGLSHVNTVTISGAASLQADLSGNTTLTSVNASASTGANRLTIDASKAAFTGGTGADRITLTATSIDKNISLGGGDDRLILRGVTGLNANLDGGAGVDGLEVDASFASTLTGVTPAFSNFETVQIFSQSNHSIDLSAFGASIETVITSGQGVLTLTSVANVTSLTSVVTSGMTGVAGDFTHASVTSINTSGGGGASTLTIDGSKTAFTGGMGVDTITVAAGSVSKAIDLGDGDDRLNLTSATGLTAALNGGAGTDTLVLTTAFIPTLLGHPFDISNFEVLELLTQSASTVDLSSLAGFRTLKFTGAFDLTVTGTDAALTAIDASAMMTGAFTLTTGAFTDDTTVKGLLSGTNSINVTAGTAKVTYIGGSGNDILTVNDGAHDINFGLGGADSITITGAASDQTVHISVTGFGLQDELVFLTTLGSASQMSLGAQTGGGASTLLENLDLAATIGDGATSLMTWFQFDGNTYAVLDNSADNTFQAETDVVVKLVGNINLSDSTFSGGRLIAGSLTGLG